MKMSKIASLTTRRGRHYMGPIADEPIPGVQVRCRKIPSEAWYAAHPDGATEPPGDEDMVIQTVILGSLSYPSRLKPQANWDTGTFPVAELAVTPYLDWKAAADRDIASRNGGQAPLGALPPDPEAHQEEDETPMPEAG